jgi:phi13 family phage major tail protein
MTVANEYKPRVGLDSLYVAAITKDDSTGFTAGTPVYLAPAADASLAPNASQDVLYADDQPWDVLMAEAETKVSLSVTNISMALLAAMTGRVFDVASGQLWDNAGGSPAYYALGFRSLKSNGKYRYYWFLKGTFEMPPEDFTTKGAKPDPKMVKLAFTAIKTIYKFTLGSITDSVKRVMGDEDTLNFSATGWFTQVVTPATSVPGAFTLSSSSPVNDAATASKTADITLTFSNPIPTADLTNIALYDINTPATPVLVATTKTLDATQKVVTMVHAGLTASHKFMVAFPISDVYGQVIAAPMIEFTTTS